MALFGPAVQTTLENEGGFFHNQQTGEVVNFGITVWFLRSCGILQGSGAASLREIEFVRSMSRDYAIELYRRNFWAPCNFAALDAQILADKAFDLAVNMGKYAAVMLLQQALNDVTQGTYKVDGVLGPKTAHGCNTTNEAKLYQAYLARAEARYRAIARNPTAARIPSPDCPTLHRPAPCLRTGPKSIADA